MKGCGHTNTCCVSPKEDSRQQIDKRGDTIDDIVNDNIPKRGCIRSIGFSSIKSDDTSIIYKE